MSLLTLMSSSIHVLNRLGPTYSNISHALQAWDTPVTFEELFERLLSYEAQLQILVLSAFVTPPTRHPVLSEGVIFFPVYYKLITFKLVHSYNVKHLTCTISCSSGLQNIYKLHI